jgi:hypothetical protein
MKTIVAIVFLIQVAASQSPPATTANPLPELKERVQQALAAVNLPFTEEQDKAIILMMEDRRKASEDLFGDLMNFSGGPTQGQDADRLRSAIAWMQNEFLRSLKDYLTLAQLDAWERSPDSRVTSADSEGQSQTSNQTQYVRINNNSFTAEDGGYRFSRNAAAVQVTEVIQRGGSGAWHGNAQFLLKDARFNAGRRFAQNKPPYQERQVNVDVSGPLIPGKLTTSFAVTQNEARNVDTIRATLPDSVFSLGITRPSTTRSLTLSNTFQLSDSTSFSVIGDLSSVKNRNQGVGGFVLPERAYSYSSRAWKMEMKLFSSLSPRRIYEMRFNTTGNHDQTTPNMKAVQVTVLDAFSGGGAQNELSNTGRVYEFGNLYSQFGEKLTLKTGFNGVYRKNRSFSQNTFLGSFTFSSLDGYLRGKPILFRVNGGKPELEVGQWEYAFFAQNDLRLTPRLTLMYGSRYEFETNIHDPNNVDGRLGFAYALQRATVLRGGIGTFHQRIPLNLVENYRRRDGVRQYELVIDSPSFPDPFQSGAARNPSVRRIDPQIVTPYNFVFLLSYERTFLNNLFVSLAYDRNREAHRLRPRNLNAPMDITSAVPASCHRGQTVETCVRPFPNQGNIIMLESSASDIMHNFRANMRERFGIFTVTANYAFTREWLDSVPATVLGNNIGGAAAYGPEGLNSDQYSLASDWAIIVVPKHNVDTTINARLPLGIFLTNTTSYKSRGKYTITTGTDDNQDGSVNDRPPGVARSTGIGANSIVFNFNVSKAFFIGGTGTSAASNINVFANVTNAFNRPNYAAPSGVLTSPNFGKSTSAGEPRKIEIGLRYQF